MSRLAFGVDVGGTFAKIAAVTRAGKVLRKDEIPTDPHAGPADFTDRLCAVLGSWRRRGLRAEALGFAVAGDVDHERGRLRLTPNLPGWPGYPFRDALRRRLRLPTVMENDANAAVWGAYAVELGRRPRSLIGVTLGTGVGGGIVVDGRLQRGATGTAGEIGHTRVAWPGEPCRCGSRGCLEAYAGTYGILRLARRLLRAGPGRGRVLRRLCPNLKALTPKVLRTAADQGDPLAAEVWERTGTMLGLGLADAVMLVNPEALLLLGGVSRAGDWLLRPVRRVFRERPFGTALRAVSLRCAADPDGGCVGAALLAWEETCL
ncbi:MAG: ROK family protein [Elusimicrobia bacterium]|nr:ROK family protein [Elusimicrobiota bacterium]